jgi:hypothetical protein
VESEAGLMAWSFSGGKGRSIQFGSFNSVGFQSCQSLTGFVLLKSNQFIPMPLISTRRHVRVVYLLARNHSLSEHPVLSPNLPHSNK